MGIVIRSDGSNVDTIVKYMKVGEKGYIGRGAIAFDMTGDAYLDLNAVVERKKEKSSTRIKIIRTGPKENDYHIDIRKVKVSWSLEETPFIDEFDHDFKYEVEAVKLEKIVGNYKKGNKMKDSGEDRLKSELEKAVREEKYELAAKIRDKLAKVDIRSK